MTDTRALEDLLERLTRLLAAEARGGALNPVQQAALDYLARANRFSRQPSHVADYLAATRGTVSQTLKSLMHKGLVAEEPGSGDRRVVRLALTPAGRAAAAETGDLRSALANLPKASRDALAVGLPPLLAMLIARRGGRSFGRCRSCRHHRNDGGVPRCALLNLVLAPDEPDQLCVEHSA